MNKHILTIILLTAALFSGCTKEYFDPNGNAGKRGNKDGSIAFYPAAKNMMQTRGTPQTSLDVYEEIELIVYRGEPEAQTFYRKTTLTPDVDNTTKWVYELPAMLWPQGGKLSFIAYACDLPMGDAGITINETNSIPASISYTVPQVVENQPDLLVATVPAQTLPIDAVVDIDMQHALSCVSFCATSLEGKYIHKINIKWVASSGTYTLGTALDDKAWDITGADRSISFTAGTNDEQIQATYTDLNYLMNGDGYLMMVPQDLTGTGAQIEVWYSDVPNATDETSERFVYQIPEGTVWLPGQKYVYIMDEGAPVGAVTYYEVYDDGSLGLFYYNGMGTTPVSTIVDSKSIMDAGYGLLVPEGFYTHYSASSINMGVGANDLASAAIYSYGTDNIVATGVKFGTSTFELNCVLYTQTQNSYPYGHAGANSATGICPSATNSLSTIVATIGADGVSITTYGKCLPHYARGVYNVRSSDPHTHYIRTPMQMRNISYQTLTTQGQADNTNGNTYVQEFPEMDYTGAAGNTVCGNDVAANGYKYYESIVWGTFNGTFDGKNIYPGSTPRSEATITNLTFDNTGSTSSLALAGDYPMMALFEGNSGVISNLTNTNSSLSQNNSSGINVAMYVGYNYGTVRYLTNTAPVTNTTNNRVSGIVAWNTTDKATGALIQNCINTSTAIISGRRNVAGIAAYNQGNGRVDDCQNYATITATQNTSDYIGGIVGLQQCIGEPADPIITQPVISNCTNEGTITSGSTTGTKYIGGIVGCSDWNHGNVGNNTPFTSAGRVTLCVNKGDVMSSSTSAQVGGIGGQNNGTIDHCQSTGTISGGVYVGGIAGYHTGDITDCMYYNSDFDCQISGTNAGGIVGYIVPAAPNYSESGYINRCLVLAVSPTSPYVSDRQTDGITPASGFLTGEYLFRYPSNGALGTNLDATGKIIDPNIPIYCINNIFVLSGFNVVSPYNPSSSGISESTATDVLSLSPFISGRYPFGINRLCTAMFSDIPFSNWYNKYGWTKGTTYPYVVEDISSNMPSINDGGGAFVSQLHGMVSAIRNAQGSSVSYSFPSVTIVNTLRFDLFDMDGVPANLTSISINLGNVTFDNPGTATIKAPKGWKITSGLNGFGYGDPVTGYYQYVSSVGIVIMAKQ